LGIFGYVEDARFSPQGDRILIRSGGVHEYDAHSGARIRNYGRTRDVAASYSADAQRVAVTSELGFTTIYDAVTGEETLRLEEGGFVIFARDGTALLANGGPGGLTYWPGRKESAR
jgi:hypothetical protein